MFNQYHNVELKFYIFVQGFYLCAQKDFCWNSSKLKKCSFWHNPMRGMCDSFRSGWDCIRRAGSSNTPLVVLRTEGTTEILAALYWRLSCTHCGWAQFLASLTCAAHGVCEVGSSHALGHMLVYIIIKGRWNHGLFLMVERTKVLLKANMAKIYYNIIVAKSTHNAVI